MSNPLWDLIEGAGYVLDTPGALTRGLLAGRPGERVGGRDLLESWGVLDKNQEGLDAGDVAGFGAEMLLDPLNLVGGGALRKLMASRGAIRQSNKGSQALRAMGAFPEELIPLQHPSMLDEAGKPRRVYHGTPVSGIEAKDLDPSLAGTVHSQGLHGRGVYFTETPVVSNSHAAKGGAGRGSTVMAHVDARNPFIPERDFIDALKKIGMPDPPQSYHSMDADAVTGFLRSKGYDSTLTPLPQVDAEHLLGELPRNAPAPLIDELTAFDKSQIYAPYIAPALQQEPSIRNPLAALLAQNLIGRSHPEYR